MTPEVTVSLLATILIFLPLPWHWRNGNVATLALIAWLFVANLIAFVDSYVWQSNLDIHDVVWCDITSRIFSGAQVALPAASFCLCLRLYNAAAAKGLSSITIQSRRRRLALELGICFGVPLIYMAMTYIAQGFTLEIIKTLGCQLGITRTFVSTLALDVPPVLFSLMTMVYAVLAVIHLRRHYQLFVENLQVADTTGFAVSHYYRLLAMATVMIFWLNGVTAFVLVGNITDGLYPYVSWAWMHYHFSQIGTYDPYAHPEVFKSYVFSLISWYSLPVSTFIFILFFSFGEDAVDEYRRILSWIYTRLGLRRLSRKLGIERRAKGSRALEESDRTKTLGSLRFNHPPPSSAGGSGCERTSEFLPRTRGEAGIEDLSRIDQHTQVGQPA